MKCRWCHKETRKSRTDTFDECDWLDCRQSRARACHTFTPDPKRDYFEQRDEEHEKVNARIAATPFVPRGRPIEYVVKSSGGPTLGTHQTRKEALAQLRAVEASKARKKKK